MKSALISGSNTGNTANVAGPIIEAMKPEITLDIIDVDDVDDELWRVRVVTARKTSCHRIEASPKVQEAL